MAVKIKLELDLTNKTQVEAFIGFLSASIDNTVAPKVASEQPVETINTVKPKAEAVKAEAMKVETPALKAEAREVVPAPNVEAQKPAHTQKAETQSTDAVTISAVRQLLTSKVNFGDNRELIFNKLREYGATSISSLNPVNYEALYTFMSGLKSE